MEKMNPKSAVWVVGHRGLVGSAIVRALEAKGYSNLILAPRSELDLLDQRGVNDFYKKHKIEYVFVAAAKVGGILFNQKYQADFLYENLTIACNVIQGAATHGVEKLLYLGSSCIYPKFAPQPITEESLLSGPLEPTNEGYAIAKIAGLKLCEKFSAQYGKRFISAMPTNLYGPFDNYHPERSHVIPGMMRRFHEAKIRGDKEVTIWGTGTPRREFLYVEDLAAALYLLMQEYEGRETINVGTGEDVTIRELAELLKKTVGFQGEIVLDSTKPDGTPRKVLDVAKLKAFGWHPHVQLEEGLKKAYEWAIASDAFIMQK